jgi:hypothetical protein
LRLLFGLAHVKVQALCFVQSTRLMLLASSLRLKGELMNLMMKRWMMNVMSWDQLI